jgi:predicted nucleotidyltransferase
MIEMQKIYDLKDAIVSQFRPQKVILFGSYAYGNPNEDSDVDLLVVLPFEGRTAHKSAEIATALKPAFATDILVRTPEQIQERLAIGDVFLKEIFSKGKTLYENRS